MTTTSNKPEHRIRVGGVVATIWRRSAKDSGEFFTVDLQRPYRDRDGTWQYATSFTSKQLLEVAKAADLAHTWVLAREAERQQQQRPAGGPAKAQQDPGEPDYDQVPF